MTLIFIIALIIVISLSPTILEDLEAMDYGKIPYE